MNNDILKNLKTTFRVDALSEVDVFSNPFQQFEKWFNDVIVSEIPEPNAMVIQALATVDHSRIGLADCSNGQIGRPATSDQNSSSFATRFSGRCLR